MFRLKCASDPDDAVQDAIDLLGLPPESGDDKLPPMGSNG